MLQIILVLVYLALLVWTWLPDWYYNWADNLFSTMMLTLLLAFLMFFNLGMAIMISRVEVGRSDATCYIYSLRNEAEINGQFFIGSGYINQRQRYFYFWKNDRGGFCLGSIPVNNVELFQDENVKPRMDWQNIHYRQNRWIWTWPTLKWKIVSMISIFLPIQS